MDFCFEQVFKRTENCVPTDMVTNFRLEDSGAGETLVTTETRVFATDAATRKKIAAYWRVIYPGSALIRRMLLRALKKRAEEPFG